VISRLKRGAIPLGLALASLAVAVLQRPGLASSDTKIDLHLDPSGYLAAVASPWSESFGLGAVWSGQYTGYLWPMGPLFALGHGIGLPAWLVQRLWLGLVLALAAWGTVLLVDALHDRRRGVAHLVAGVVAVANPYVVVFSNRTSITLLAYAALPWLLMATQRGLRDPRGWRWPAAFALILTSAGGGVNAATTAWVLLAPVLLVLYELGVLRLPWRSAMAFAARTLPLVALASAWWIVPTLVQASYGLDFLPFTEQPDVIWHTSSLSEGLRGMGYWLAYTEIGVGPLPVPYLSDAGTLLFDPAVLVASLLIPALAVAGFVATRRLRYGPFLLAMVLLGTLVMAAGFPEGTPLRRAITTVYENVQAVQFLRTTYKAGPLVLIGLAVLLGLGAEAAWSRLRTPAARVAAAGLAVAIVALAAWPLTTGVAVDRQVTYDIPRAWTDAAADLDSQLPRGTRAVVLPGSLFGFYRWGAVTDPIMPALTGRPVATRFVVPYSDLRAIDLLWTVDGLVEEQRALPGQLRPLLSLMGAGAVVVPTDYDPLRSGSVPAADAARTLARGGLATPSRAYGPVRRARATASSLDAPMRLPELRSYDLLRTPGMVRVEPRGPATVVDGSASGVTSLAAFGALTPGRPLLYAGDQSPDELRRLARHGATIAITDSNRRRAFVNSRIRANAGRTLDAGVELPPDFAALDPFERGAAAETTAVYTGVRWVRGTIEASFSQFPERGPMAAFDGDRASAWVTNAFLRQGERPYVEVGFREPRDVAHVDLLPYADSRGRPVEVTIAGRRHALHRGWNRLELGLRDVSSLRVEISKSAAPPRGGGPGGFRELRVPGLRVSQRLRTPLLAAHALRGEPLERSRVTVLLERTSAFAPWRRDPVVGELQARSPRDRGDAERAIARVVELPASRRFAADAWVSAGPSTPDAELDRLAGTTGASFSSSGRFESVPGRRASRAFDGRGDRGWVGLYAPGRPAFLGWRTAKPRRLTELHLERDSRAVRVPTRVRLRWPGGETPLLPVGPDGTIALPHAVRARRVRLDVLAARFPAGTPARARARRAVGIGELSGPGLPRAHSLPASAPISGRCGDASLAADGRTVPLRPAGTVGELERGEPLRARGCRDLALAAGRRVVTTAEGPLRVDLLRLDSPAPRPVPATGGGRVLDPGDQGRGKVDGARLRLDGPSWLVLGESYNRGWRASCDGRELGEPVPIDGYANGWRVSRCSSASFAFAPAGPVKLSYLVSMLSALALLALLLLTRRRDPEPLRDPLAPGRERPRRWRPLPALAAGGAAAVVLGFVFALRAGVVLGPLLALALWRGTGARALSIVAAVLLGIVVPAIYLLFTPPDLGGYNSSYPMDVLGAHWVAVAAVACAALALVRAAVGLRAGAPAPESVSRARAPSDARGRGRRGARAARGRA
jgi:hypothetical protein